MPREIERYVIVGGGYAGVTPAQRHEISLPGAPGIEPQSTSSAADSVAVIDQVLKHDLPQGPCWRRYNHDGYGQKDDGSAFDGSGVGCSWPILAGERGHYELAGGRDPKPFIAAPEKFTEPGGMLPEKPWDANDLPERNLKFGGAAGSAMPLCWARAEYISLARSRHDRVCFGRVEPIYQRYAKGKAGGNMVMWTFAHQPGQLRKGNGPRIITEQSAKIHWSVDGWSTSSDLETSACSFGLHWTDLPNAKLPRGAKANFPFYWAEANRWEGRDFPVAVAGTSQSSP